jgi:hypothetical protein
MVLNGQQELHPSKCKVTGYTRTPADAVEIKGCVLTATLGCKKLVYPKRRMTDICKDGEIKQQ